MKKTNESGRSMVEMLGVLAIIGVLSIGGIAGYSMAMNRYRANEILDKATKYAVIVYSSYQTAQALGKDWDGITFDEADLGTLPENTKIELAKIGGSGEDANNLKSPDNGVELDITFPTTAVCQAAATILGVTDTCSSSSNKITKTFAQS